jgi:hypothetical protein
MHQTHLRGPEAAYEHFCGAWVRLVRLLVPINPAIFTRGKKKASKLHLRSSSLYER